jgi:hypothetical protein
MGRNGRDDRQEGGEYAEGEEEKKSEYNRYQKRQATNTNPMTNAEGKQRRWKETEEEDKRKEGRGGERDKHKRKETCIDVVNIRSLAKRRKRLNKKRNRPRVSKSRQSAAPLIGV